MEINGNGVVHVYLNNEHVKDVEVSSNYIQNMVIEEIKPGVNEIGVISDFYVIENSGRSEDGKLSCLLYDLSLE